MNNSIQWMDCSGRISLELTKEMLSTIPWWGRSDESIAQLMKDPEVKRQMEALNSEQVRLALKYYGAWDDKTLSDETQNLHRILWVACGDLKDGMFGEADMGEQL